MNFIKKLADKKSDELVHAQFQKFSKGEFRDRAMIRVKKSGPKYTIYTGAEFANGLVRIMAEKLGDNKTNVKGAIVSTLNLKENPEFSDLLAHATVKQFQGVKRYLVDTEMSGKEIINFLDKNPKAFFALSFEAGEDKLKIKPKAPKSGKPGKGGEDPKIDFCVLKTKDKTIADSFVFETSDFKEAIISHTYFIESMEIPEELKKSKDFAKMREGAIRIGKIVRKAKIDGQERTSEIELRA